MTGLSPGALFAGFRIDGVLGRGGMGVIYRATELRPERTVALKVVAPELAVEADFRERFLRESQLAAEIEHPHVVPVLRVGEEAGLLYIAMRFIRGSDLAALIASERRLEPLRAARIIDQVGYALDAAHERGLVHRDVKPANVLIEHDRRGDHAYLADFGLTKLAAGNKITATGMMVGTVDYMPPEQFNGGPLDARADVYALGCVLFETLTGRVPYERDSLQARIYAHMTAPPPAVSGLEPGVPRPFDDVVCRALAKNPDDRYLSAGDLGRAALAAAEGQSLTRAERSVATGEAAPRGPSTVVSPAAHQASIEPPASATSSAPFAPDSDTTAAVDEPPAAERPTTADDSAVGPTRPSVGAGITTPRASQGTQSSSAGESPVPVQGRTGASTAHPPSMPAAGSEPNRRSGRRSPGPVIVGGCLLGVAILIAGLIALGGGSPQARGTKAGGSAAASVDHARTMFVAHCGSCHYLSAAGTAPGPRGRASSLFASDDPYARAHDIGPNLDTLQPPAALILHTIKFGCVPRPTNPASPQACLGRGAMPSGLLRGADAQVVANYIVRVTMLPQSDTAGLAVFTGSAGCSSCHTLAAAHATGTVGPNLDLRLRSDCATAASIKIRGASLAQCVKTAIDHPYSYIPADYAAGIMPSNYAANLTSTQISSLVDMLVVDTGDVAAEDRGVIEIDADPTGQLKFTASSATATAGEVTLRMRNMSSVPHDIAITGAGVNSVGAVVSNGGSSTLHVHLNPGTYTFYCSVDGHRAAGMYGTLTVK